MKDKTGLRVSTATAIAVPAAFALPAIDIILNEFARHPGGTSLALNMQELRIPFEAMISVPVEALVSPGGGRNEWHLKIRASSNPHVYPTFDGILRLISAPGFGSELELHGTYAPPFGAIGRAIDTMLLGDAAQASLQRFVRDVANRTAALSHWAQFA